MFRRRKSKTLPAQGYAGNALYKLNQSIYCLASVIPVAGRLVMSTVEKIKPAISVLSKEDYIHLREWFSEKDWEQWDKEIEREARLLDGRGGCGEKTGTAQ